MQCIHKNNNTGSLHTVHKNTPLVPWMSFVAKDMDYEIIEYYAKQFYTIKQTY